MIYVTNKNIGLTGGGDAVVAMEIINSLHSSGLDVASVSMKYQIPKSINETFSSIKNFRLPFIPEKEKYSKQKFGALKYFLKNSESLIKQAILKRQLSKTPPKVIITNDLLTGRYLLKKYRDSVKIIQVVHNIPSFFEDLKDEDLNDHFDYYNRVDRVIFVSDVNRKKWLSYEKLDENKTSYIYNCANESLAKKVLRDSKSTVRKRLKMNPDKFYLVTVASLNPQKGLDYLMEAAPKLKEIAPNLGILVIGAENTAYETFLKDKSDEKIKDVVKFLGFKSNAMEYVYASDAFILPSRAEGFPLVILEAMVVNTPVLASRVGGIPEMLDHERTGLLFESGNNEELIKCFKRMYLNQDDRNRYADQASKKYWEKFSKRNFTEQYVELIKNLGQ